MNASGPDHVLRPHGATVLSILVWAILGAMAIEAVLAAGLEGLRVLPGLALLAALIWAVLWAPRLVLLAEGVRVRNLLHTYALPFARIQEVRLGMMVRFDVDALDGKPRKITAWNAPGIGRDNPLGREVAMATDVRGIGLSSRGQTRRRLSRGERLVRDQNSSRSAIVRERWEQWHLQHPAGGEAVAERSLNLATLSVVGVLIVVVAVQLAL